MKVKLDILFTEMVTPPRCRKPRPREGETEITVNIREVAEERAPIAFLVNDYGREQNKVRQYNGKLYRQVQDRREDWNNDTDCLDTKPLWINQRAEQVNWQWLLVRRTGKYMSGSEWRELTWDYGSQAEQTSYSKKQTEKYILVNGEAYERTGEPYYYVNTFGLGRNHGGTGFFVGWADYHDRKKVWGWSAADTEGAVEKAVKIALGRGDTESVVSIRDSTYYRIEVLIPQAIKRTYARGY